MNILFLTTHLNTGGITSYLLSLSRGLQAQGHQVFVASAGGDCENIFKNDGGRHFNLGFRTKSEIDPRIYLSLGPLKKFVYKENINIIHAQTRVTQVMGYFLARMSHKPLVTTCHGFFKPRFFRRIFSCWGQAVIAISKPVKEHLVRDFGLDPKKVHWIANGIDCSKFVLATEALKQQTRQRWNIQAKFVIGLIARFSDVKGIDVLIKSMPLVIQQYPDVLFMVVGQGPEQEKLFNLAEGLNLKTHVRFENIVNQTADILPAFDLFVMPSRQEGLGLSVMEAQSCGLPVIASGVGGLVDLIEDGKTGYLVSAGDSKALAAKINEVLRNPLQAREVGLAAREYIARNFSLEKMVSATEKIYERNCGFPSPCGRG
ncbi:MAG: glycosyltransferase family 4 protein [Candidatus Omnitrophica bacterium]|nr:glycosyltransferase family 4 protein [Candidatus Omnitrophota bacterium]